MQIETLSQMFYVWLFLQRQKTLLGLEFAMLIFNIGSLYLLP